MGDVSEYKVGIVLTSENCGHGGGGKALKACKVNIGDSDNPITVVTAAPNVRVGSRLAVAVVGSTIIGDDGEEIVVQKTSVGGVMSEGIFCDSKMLGWIGGSEGVAQQIPDSIEVGAAPPSSKPRVQFDGSQEASGTPSVEVKPLFEKKLSKEEKKKLAEEKRKAKKAAKESKNDDAQEETS